MQTQSKSEKVLIHCMKLHLPWELMCKRAEDMGLVVPIEVRPFASPSLRPLPAAARPSAGAERCICQ